MLCCAVIRTVLQYLPKLVLAAVVVIAIIQLIELEHILRFWKVQKR